MENDAGYPLKEKSPIMQWCTCHSCRLSDNIAIVGLCSHVRFPVHVCCYLSIIFMWTSEVISHRPNNRRIQGYSKRERKVGEIRAGCVCQAAALFSPHLMPLIRSAIQLSKGLSLEVVCLSMCTVVYIHKWNRIVRLVITLCTSRWCHEELQKSFSVVN